MRDFYWEEVLSTTSFRMQLEKHNLSISKLAKKLSHNVINATLKFAYVAWPEIENETKFIM